MQWAIIFHLHFITFTKKSVLFPVAISHKTEPKLDFHWIIQYGGGLFVQLLCAFLVYVCECECVFLFMRHDSYTEAVCHQDHRILGTFVWMIQFVLVARKYHHYVAHMPHSQSQ